MHPDQTVSEMVEEVLERQAKMLADGTGQTLERAMAAALKTDEARRLKELAESPYGEQRAAEWQTGLPRARAEERHYSWLEGYMEWLEGKQKRTQYHALLGGARQPEGMNSQTGAHPRCEARLEGVLRSVLGTLP